MKKTTLSILGAVALLLCAVACGNKTADKHNEPEYECIAYVWEADGQLPPADKVTAINYLAAYPNDTHDGISIHNEPRLLQILDLKKINPDLKVLLSLGGAGQEAGWGEMTACDSLRAAFVADCKRVVDKYGLDGLDFDWEFPHGDQQDNYVKLFKDVREVLGPDKRVTAAVGFFGNGFDLREAIKYLDYVNLMSYDMGWQAPYHHTSLRRSELSGVCTLEEAIDSCLNKGLDYKDIVVGLAFYGRGDGTNFKDWTDYRDIVNRDLSLVCHILSTASAH